MKIQNPNIKKKENKETPQQGDWEEDIQEEFELGRPDKIKAIIRQLLLKEREEILEAVEQIMRDTLSANTLKYHKEVNKLYLRLDKLKEKWVWMPHAGHLIVSRDCQFHLNTYVGKYIVSTIGEYWPDRQVREIHAKVYDPKWLSENQHLLGDTFDHAYMEKFGYEEIGCDRKYETMVFSASKSKDECCPYRANNWSEIDSDGYNSAGDAFRGHLKMCEKWSKTQLTN